ncbi:beta ketoadipyl CoA thiolase, partial [Aureobasidium pullulans]
SAYHLISHAHKNGHRKTKLSAPPHHSWQESPRHHKNPDDIVITLAIRTPLTKAGKGGFKDTHLDGLVFKLLEQVVQKSRIDPQMVEDICLGNVSDAKAAYYVRAACLAAGFPNTTAAYSTNRFCSSGLKATQDIANQIMAGAIEIGVAIGAESMTDGGDRLTRPFVDDIVNANQDAADCLQPMGQTSENVGKDFNISRQEQDKYAAESYRRAEVAQKAGWFDDEITSITVKVKDPKTGEVKDVKLTRDEGPRYGTTAEALGKIRPAFPDYGDRSTGGNSSQVTDGAAAVLLMKRSKALELGQPIVAKFVGATVAGLAPRIMGIGPSIAIPKLLSKYQLSLDDIDVIELNEAFASMAVYCRDTLKIDWSKMNIRGGAIALGHPLGATGARQIVTGLSECRRQKKKILLTSMCIGTGMGMAGLFVNEQL